MLSYSRWIPLFVVVSFLSALNGCGGVGAGSSATPDVCIADAHGTANLPILFTSDAPLGPVYSAVVRLHSVELTDACGKSVTIWTSPVVNTAFSQDASIEFWHVNGVSEPLSIATGVPQATYTSARVVYTGTELAFGGNYKFNASVAYINPLAATTEVPTPIAIGSAGTALELDLLLATPIDITSTNSAGGPNASIAPVFRLSGIETSAAPADDRHGLAAVFGTSSAVSGNQLTMLNSAGLPLTLQFDAATGISGTGTLAGLPPNLPINVQVAVRSDGSLYARRVSVEDATAKGIYAGPLVQTYSSGAYQFIEPTWLYDQSQPLFHENAFPLEFQFDANTQYKIADTQADFRSIPFTPQWSSFADVALGQSIDVNWQTEQYYANQPQTEAHTAVLLPRSFSVTVSAVQAGPSYTMYSLQLDSTDTLAATAGLTTISAYSNAATVLEDGVPSVGEAVTAHGFVFNDRGVLRLVCDQIRAQRMP